MRLRARWYATGELRDFTNADGRHWTAGPPDPVAPPDREAGWAAPALFDLQINGCDGRSFNSPQLTVDDVRHVVEVCRRHGVAGLCPTLVTAIRRGPAARLRRPAAGVRDGCRDRPRRAGAAPGRAVHQPRGRPARRPSAAPRPAAGLGRVPPLPRCFRRPHPPGHAGAGTRRRLGVHRAADRVRRGRRAGPHGRVGPRLRDAVRAGARLSTHLGNGCSAVLPRHDNPIWEQLADG